MLGQEKWELTERNMKIAKGNIESERQLSTEVEDHGSLQRKAAQLREEVETLTSDFIEFQKQVGAATSKRETTKMDLQQARNDLARRIAEEWKSGITEGFIECKEATTTIPDGFRLKLLELLKQYL